MSTKNTDKKAPAAEPMMACVVIADAFQKGSMNCRKGTKLHLEKAAAKAAEKEGFIKIIGLAN